MINITLTEKVAFEPSYTSKNAVMLHIQLNQLKHRKPLTRSIISFNGARINFIFYRKMSQFSNRKYIK